MHPPSTACLLRWQRADPANSPIFAPDGLTGNARRAFNKVHVPYDAEKQNYAPLAAREIENSRADSPKGTWSYIPIQIGTATRTMGVYLPPGYDANPAEPYKTIYMQHGGGQGEPTNAASAFDSVPATRSSRINGAMLVNGTMQRRD